jgi:prepilin signal peptidase PulO-like enzyme (type II secretory pathway)
VTLVAAQRGKGRTTFPFAPFLVVGALEAILTR